MGVKRGIAAAGQSRYNTLFIMNISILDDKGKGRCASDENWLF